MIIKPSLSEKEKEEFRAQFSSLLANEPSALSHWDGDVSFTGPAEDIVKLNIDSLLSPAGKEKLEQLKKKVIERAILPQSTVLP